MKLDEASMTVLQVAKDLDTRSSDFENSKMLALLMTPRWNVLSSAMTLTRQKLTYMEHGPLRTHQRHRH